MATKKTPKKTTKKLSQAKKIQPTKPLGKVSMSDF